MVKLEFTKFWILAPKIIIRLDRTLWSSLWFLVKYIEWGLASLFFPKLWISARASLTPNQMRTERCDRAFDILKNTNGGVSLCSSPIFYLKIIISGIILNLTVVISIQEKASLKNNTVNVVLGNLCFANLIEAVFVKTIAVVYHGYAVARSRYRKLPIHDLNHFHYFYFACQIWPGWIHYLLPYTYSCLSLRTWFSTTVIYKLQYLIFFQVGSGVGLLYGTHHHTTSHLGGLSILFTHHLLAWPCSESW